MTPEEQALRDWDKGNDALERKLRDPAMAEQMFQEAKDTFRRIAQLKELDRALGTLRFDPITASPEQRKKHFDKGKAVKAGDFEEGEN